MYYILLAGGTAVAGFAGYKWVSLNRPPDLDFLDRHRSMISDLADLIIPRTDTPGAKDVEAGEFVIRMVKEVCNRRTQNNFIDGLKEMEVYTSDTYRKRFSDLSIAEQSSIATVFQEKGRTTNGLVGKLQHKVIGKPFFITLKEATVIGYCTSRAGATQGLAYDYIPGVYNGCVPMTPNQKSWATK